MSDTFKQEIWTIAKLIQWAAKYLTGYGVDSPRLSAELMLTKVFDCKRVDLYLRYDQPLSKEELTQFKTLLIRRRNHEPMAYIMGEKEFYGLDLKVGKGVLIPRPETEHLVEEGINLLKDFENPCVLDLCTGSGAIALALAANLSAKRVIGVDISRKALAYAEQNAISLNLADKTQWFLGDLFDPIDPTQGFFDLITANPPYVTNDEWSSLDKGVKDYEPRLALAADNKGMAVVARIVRQASVFLRPQAWLLIELGDKQAKQAQQIVLDTKTYESCHIIKDLAGIQRVLACQRKDYG